MQKRIDDSVVELERLNVGYSSPIYTMQTKNAGIINKPADLVSDSIKNIEAIEENVAKRLEEAQTDSSVESDDLDLISELNRDVIGQGGGTAVKQISKKVTTRNLDIF